jgi:IstB-like ATP binding protein
MELDRRGAELLFQVLTEREEKNSMAIASNENFSGWTKTFTDPGSARPSSTASPSAATSSRPAATPTASRKPGPGPGTPPADNRTRCPLPRDGFAGEFRPRLGAGLTCRDGRLHAAAGPSPPWPCGGPAAVLPGNSSGLEPDQTRRLVQNPGTTLAHLPMGGCPADPGSTESSQVASTLAVKLRRAFASSPGPSIAT